MTNNIKIHMIDTVGLVSGRFQPFHITHQELIDVALKIYDKVVILISDAKLDDNNWFTYEQRVNMIKSYLDSVGGNYNRVIFGVAPSKLETGETWARALYDGVKDATNGQRLKPDGLVFGSDKLKWDWYDDDDIKDVDFHVIGRTDMDISATKVRNLIMDNDVEKALEFIPCCNQQMIKDIAEEMLTYNIYCDDNTIFQSYNIPMKNQKFGASCVICKKEEDERLLIVPFNMDGEVDLIKFNQVQGKKYFYTDRHFLNQAISDVISSANMERLNQVLVISNKFRKQYIYVYDISDALCSETISAVKLSEICHESIKSQSWCNTHNALQVLNANVDINKLSFKHKYDYDAMQYVQNMLVNTK